MWLLGDSSTPVSQKNMSLSKNVSMFLFRLEKKKEEDYTAIVVDSCLGYKNNTVQTAETIANKFLKHGDVLLFGSVKFLSQVPPALTAHSSGKECYTGTARFYTD